MDHYLSFSSKAKRMQTWLGNPFKRTGDVLMQTQDREQLSQTLTRLWGSQRSSVSHCGHAFSAEVCATKLSAVQLLRLGARGAFQIDSQVDLNSGYLVYLMHKGRLEIGLGSKTYVCDQESLVVVSVHPQVTVRIGPESQGCFVAIPAAALESALSTLLNRKPTRTISFCPLIPRSRPGVETLLRLIEYLFQECSHSDGPRTSTPLAVRQLEGTLLTLVLESLPHTYSDEILSALKPAEPWHVRRCEEYILANLDQPLSIADLAAAVKASPRTLHEGFRRYREYSPMEFLRKARLERARKELLDPTNTKTVTEVAVDWCFWHLGRFSRTYFEAFGEKPSETLSRARKALNVDRTAQPLIPAPFGEPWLARSSHTGTAQSLPA